MARVTTVDKARQSPGSCAKCGKVIKVGDPYIWWAFFRSGRRVRCTTCPRPRQSELTNNDKLSQCYAAAENISDAIDHFRDAHDIEDLRSALESAAEQVREAAEMYRESASNIEEGFQHTTSQSDELNEKADNLESKADEIDGAASALEEFDEEEANTDAEAEFDDKVENREEKVKKFVEDKKQDWIDEQATMADEFTDISPD